MSARRHTNSDSKRGISTSCDFRAQGICDMIEDIDEVNADAYGPKAGTGKYAQGGWYDKKSNTRVAKAGVYAKATTGRAEGNC